MFNRLLVTIQTLLLAAFGAPAFAAVFLVGPDMPYSAPSQAAAVARDGDIVEIEAAEYSGDVAVWTQNNLVLRGVGGRPHLRAAGKAAEGKAIWVIKGNDTVVENVEFSGAAVSDRNGAGIRLEGTNLIVRNSVFHHNENGILTGADPASEVLVEFSEFGHNGYGDGQSHNLYIGRIAAFTMRFSYSHHARVGHQVKSRAERNTLEYNRFSDELSGTSSYLIDLPNPGDAVVLGNILQQGTETENSAMIHTAQSLKLINNTMVNDRSSGYFMRTSGDVPELLLQNNLIVGQGRFDIGKAININNLETNEPGFVARMAYDYRLQADSPAIDAGLEPESSALRPVSEYRHESGKTPRLIEGRIDVGAFEYRSDL